MISLLINSWKRPDNIRSIIEAQKDYDLIGEILIFNNNPEINIEYSHHKIKIINSNIDFGLRTRWVNGVLAENDCLVFQDDDLIAKENAFEKMWSHFNDDPERIYCAWGRNASAEGLYSMKNCYGEVEIALTCLACVSKKAVPFVISAERMFFEHNGLDWVYTNGEDIFLSYCVSNLYNKPALQIDLPVHHLPAPHSLHKKSSHKKERTIMVLKCREFFNKNPRLYQEKMSEYLDKLQSKLV
tara:strand:+ start:491 stop:1216 length:726 start_codon:yes stop_codon:yes gene_type:complete